MTFALFRLATAVLQAVSPQSANGNATEQTSCLVGFANDFHSTGEPVMMIGRMVGSRLESVDVYSDGAFLRSVQIRFGAMVSCRGKVSLARAARLKTELAATKVCRLRQPRPSDEEDHFVSVYIDRGRHCRLALSAKDWIRNRATSAVGRIVDEFVEEVCKGKCPEPPFLAPKPDEAYGGTYRPVVPQVKPTGTPAP
jgi:hypothetical protein